LPNQAVTLLAIPLHTRGAFAHRRRVFADKEAVGLWAAIGLSLLRTHYKPIVLAHAFPLSFCLNTGRAQSVFTSRICSTVSHFASCRRGAPKTSASPLARETATLIRLRENRKSMPRGVSSADDAVIETRQTGASCPWNLST